MQSSCNGQEVGPECCLLCGVALSVQLHLCNLTLVQELQVESAPGLFQVYRVSLRDEEEEDVAHHFYQVGLHTLLSCAQYTPDAVLR